jgi:hypothetical protein
VDMPELIERFQAKIPEPGTSIGKRANPTD